MLNTTRPKGVIAVATVKSFKKHRSRAEKEDPNFKPAPLSRFAAMARPKEDPGWNPGRRVKA
jgi:hypothetical protein